MQFVSVLRYNSSAMAKSSRADWMASSSTTKRGNTFSAPIDADERATDTVIASLNASFSAVVKTTPSLMSRRG